MRVHWRTLAFGAVLLGCHREPVPSEQYAACDSICETVACVDPGIEADALERCVSYCYDKADASVEQGTACEDAFARGLSCLAELSCSEYEVWATSGPGASCPSARAEVEDACQGIELDAHILPP
ncbi:hypothetical protein ENSA5_25700 [Enhygromyxa salina]|uniref:Lipoprotein n=1 Tax=Enhygromyxa salina TaxID=215803 RepID=A0A2S9YAS1_9BACT|nr:hypothetical protein ENSA5_25700 [Enhygromyxa salina]